jgi:hypothetical protein
MNKKLTYVGVVVLVVIIGAFLYMQKAAAPKTEVKDANATTNAAEDTQAKQDSGTYAYACDNGSEFSMTPAADMASLVLVPGTKATFSKSTLMKKDSSAGTRYEGNGLVFVGAGESVQLTTAQTTLKCEPKPNSDMAPFNFGDAGEGGGIKPDLVLVVSESIVGKWRSIDDSKFVREFKADGSVTDIYQGKTASTGTWKVFTKEKPVSVSFPLMDNVTYLQIAVPGSQSDTLNFSVDKLTPDELNLTYMDRGGALRFKSIK